MIRYRRITPWSPGIVRSGALFDGGDHLLQVTSLRVSEEYQRFRYDEIRAIVITELPTWTIARGVIAALMAIAIGLALLLPTLTARIVVGMFPMAGLALVVWAVAQGRRCQAVLVSSWKTWPLPALRTMRVAREVMPALSTRIMEAQSGLAPPAGAAHIPVVSTSAAARNPGRLWWGTAFALAATAAIDAVAYFPSELKPTAVFLLLSALPVTLVLLALVRRAADERMRRLADGLLTFAALDLIVHIAVAILVSQSTPGVPVGALLTVAIFWRVAGTVLSIWAARQPAAPEVL